MLNEGVDVPDASIGVILSGSASAREFIQRLGRILRRGDDKQAVLYEVIARETREERVADRRRTLPNSGQRAERIEATLALFDPQTPNPPKG